MGHLITEGGNLLNLRVVPIILTLLNPNTTTKLPYRQPVLRQRGLNYKIAYVLKAIIRVSNYNIQHQITNSVSTCGNLTRK
jgi:hypothetical protein